MWLAHRCFISIVTLAIAGGKVNFINVLMQIDMEKFKQEFVMVTLIYGSSIKVKVTYQDQPVICDLSNILDM